MTDAELLARFEDCTLEPFHHLEHVRVAWIILRGRPLPEASAHFIASLQRFAAAAGAPQKYDEALTRRYLDLIHGRMQPAQQWEEFAAANADLLVWKGAPPSSAAGPAASRRHAGEDACDPAGETPALPTYEVLR